MLVTLTKSFFFAGYIKTFDIIILEAIRTTNSILRW